MNTQGESEKKTLRGLLRVNGKGFASASIEGIETPVDIFPEGLRTGMNRDEADILLHKVRPGEKQTGEVVKIVKRFKMRFVGTVTRNKHLTFIIPDDPKMYRDIMIPGINGQSLKEGYKVYVEIVSWEDPKLSPIGNVLKIIGKKGENNVEMEAILLEKGLPSAFPEEVEAEAHRLSRIITPEEIAKRKDFRGVLTFTIDPIDAKDFDDALSYQVLPNGNIEVGIHIADVSHYVQEGTALDKEAYKRATSIYLVDRVIPMLPETLSNDLCSLNPNEDKLAFGAVFTFDVKDIEKNKLTILDEWYGKTVIHSNKRFTYEEAQDVLDGKNTTHQKELLSLNKIAHVLRKKKFDDGAIAFEKDEVKFELDKEGKPLCVVVKERKDTHKLVEDFMLLANRKVAEYIEQIDKRLGETFVYRIHDIPHPERIADLTVFLRSLGYELPTGKNGPRSKDINDLLEKIKDTPEENMIQTATIRSMAKAVYSTKNIGHYGLAFSHYAHFTSPIRRYPDLLVHRLLFSYLSKKTLPKNASYLYEEAALHSSEREQVAAEAERASIKYKQVEFFQDRVGKTYQGIISGVSEWGIYIEEKETRAEGMIRLRDLRDDFYVLDQKNYALVGEKTKKRYRLGDEVKVKVVKVDLERRIIDYIFVE